MRFNRDDYEDDDMPMRWHKFLIFFLILSTLSAFGNALKMFTGLNHGSYYDAQLYYKTFSGLKYLDVFGGIVLIIIAVLTIVTAVSLKKYKRGGPTLLVVQYAMCAIFRPLYAILCSIITKLPIEDLLDLSMPLIIVVFIIFIILNMIYYKKRTHLFVN